jgi:hypothetical protein
VTTSLLPLFQSLLEVGLGPPAALADVAVVDGLSARRWAPLSLFHAQCAARCAKAVGVTVALWVNGSSTNGSTRLPDGRWSPPLLPPFNGFATALVTLATQVVADAPLLVAMDEAEARAGALRQRLFQAHALPSGDPAGLLASAGDDLAAAKAQDHGRLTIEAAVGGGGGSGGGDHDDARQMPSPKEPSEAARRRLVAELVALGFPEEWCGVALSETGDDLAAASTWIVDNIDSLAALSTDAAASVVSGRVGLMAEQPVSGVAADGLERAELAAADARMDTLTVGSSDMVVRRGGDDDHDEDDDDEDDDELPGYRRRRDSDDDADDDADRDGRLEDGEEDEEDEEREDEDRDDDEGDGECDDEGGGQHGDGVFAPFLHQLPLEAHLEALRKSRVDRFDEEQVRGRGGMGATFSVRAL